MTEPTQSEFPEAPAHSLRQLRAGSEPSRDLWPQIEARISTLPHPSQSRPLLPHTRRPGLRLWVTAAAAACALLAVGVWIGRDGRLAGVAREGSGPRDMTDALTAACLSDSRYLHARTSLLTSPESVLAEVPSESRDRVAASLATIHDAIHDIERELTRDSANPLLQELLLHTCQDETRVLTEVQDAGTAIQPGRGI